MAQTNHQPFKTPMKKTSVIKSSNSYVLGVLSDKMKALPRDHAVFGQLTRGLVQLPRLDAVDERYLTWPKVFRTLAGKIVNKPKVQGDCWFVPSNKEDGYHELKFSKDGKSDKYRTHRILRVFSEPTAHAKLSKDAHDTDHAMHLCGRGKAAQEGEPCCINPDHVYFGPSATNQDMKGCKYGAAFLCPHEPKCIWVSGKTGIAKPCRNDPSKTSCPGAPLCDFDCFNPKLG